nr:MAG: SPASM-radical SAM protein [Lokiarchaeota virus Fenrir Meg22_1012]URC17221.1 MAG: SPASM-radical SAM protein [Lokiarchaeota virus Fenrir Meg22_1214]
MMKAKIKPRIQLENREPLAENIPLSTPWVIFVDPSDACNFRCKFCPSGNLKLLKKYGRTPTIMKLDLYEKIINQIKEFDKPIKVLRLYKDGEPLLNPSFPKMVKYAKNSGCCEKVDTTTNASMLNPDLNLKIIEAGLDRINISIEGVNEQQYRDFSGYKINFDKFVRNIEHFYDHRKDCEMIIKINGDLLSEEDKTKFFEIFGDITDGIFIEHVMNCWYDFDSEVKQNEEVGIYGQPIKEVMICPYVFYSMSVNSNGTVSVCFLDWARKMLIGDVYEEKLKEIWNGKNMNSYRKMFLFKLRKTHPICSKCSQLSHGMPVDLDDKSEEIIKRCKEIYELSDM